jgi:TfoX/Sxy family transcriptional regulator of competence genes
METDLAARVRAVLASPHVTEKNMFGGVCFLYDGNMMVAASPRGLLVRVGRDGHEKALSRPGTRPMEQKGRTLSGYIYVDDKGTRREADLRYWIDVARAEIATLPPKKGAGRTRQRSVKRPAAPKSRRAS